MKICIDAGHGPNTPGKRTPHFPDGSFMHEYTFNSAVARCVVELLQKYKDVEILTTFEDARDVPLQERTDKANAWGADVFISIHANAAGSGGWSDAHGVETFVYTTRPPKAMELAECVQKHLVDVTCLSDRGVKDADFHVLRETAMPAILCECGFMTNHQEAPLLLDDEYREACAAAIVAGIVEVYRLCKPTGTLIICGPSATVGQAITWALSRGAADCFVQLAPLYWNIAPRSEVNPAVAYAQAAKETGYGHFGGVIDATYRNPCGLKTRYGGGNYDPSAHQRFVSWEEGVEAHLDHLALYAGAPGYPKPGTPDPRHFPSICGVARTVEELGGHWAPSDSYGISIVENYLDPLECTPEPTPEPEQPDPDQWEEDAMAFLKAEGYITGDHDPDEPITMALFGAMMKNKKESV